MILPRIVIQSTEYSSLAAGQGSKEGHPLHGFSTLISREHQRHFRSGQDGSGVPLLLRIFGYVTNFCLRDVKGKLLPNSNTLASASCACLCMYVLENWANWLRLYSSRSGLRHLGGGGACARLPEAGALSSAGSGEGGPLFVYSKADSNGCGTMGCCGKKKLLMVMTSVCACASFAFLCIAVATDYWLYAVEKVFDANGSAIYMKTITGLWRKCVDDGEFNLHINLPLYFTCS